MKVVATTQANINDEFLVPEKNQAKAWTSTKREMAMLTETELLQRIRTVKDPEIGRTLQELDMLKGVQLTGHALKVKIELPTHAYPRRERITEAIRAAAQQGNSDLGTVDVEFTAVVRGNMSGGAIGLRAKNVIAVGSGKGGVGKAPWQLLWLTASRHSVVRSD